MQHTQGFDCCAQPSNARSADVQACSHTWRSAIAARGCLRKGRAVPAHDESQTFFDNSAAPQSQFTATAPHQAPEDEQSIRPAQQT